jgi:hypothetical protein
LLTGIDLCGFTALFYQFLKKLHFNLFSDFAATFAGHRQQQG